MIELTNTELTEEETAQFNAYMARRDIAPEPPAPPLPMTSEISYDLFFRFGKGEVAPDDPDFLEACMIWEVNSKRWSTIYDQYPDTRLPFAAGDRREFTRNAGMGRLTQVEGEAWSGETLGETGSLLYQLAAVDAAIADYAATPGATQATIDRLRASRKALTPAPVIARSHGNLL